MLLIELYMRNFKIGGWKLDFGNFFEKIGNVK